MLESNPHQWQKISIAIVLLIIARGIFLLCVLPPFEGWDEYQHIAYIVYIKERHELPRYGVSTVPQSMNEMLRMYPHSANDNVQTAPQGWGTRTYDTFWNPDQDQPQQEVKPVALYEAQQTPLFYLLALPFWSLFSASSYLAGIYSLRLLNLFFLAATVFIFLRTLAKCIKSVRHRIPIALLVATSPLYLVNAARVANDPLAAFFGSLTLYFTVTALKEKPIRSFTLASTFLALGILTKATMCMMAPVVAGGVLIWTYYRKVGMRASLKTLARCGLAVAVFLAPFYLYNYKVSGGLYHMTDFIYSQMPGKSIFWVWSHALDIGWATRLREWVFVREVWYSGWGFVSLPRWIRFPYYGFMYTFWFLVVGIGLKRGWGKRVYTDRPEYLFEKEDLIVFGCLIISVLAGLACFATLCLANWGAVMIIPSYFMIAFPAWTALLYQAALFLGSRFAVWFAHILLCFYVASELMGTIYLMPPAFTATTWSLQSWTRLAQIHPFFPSPWFIVPSVAMIAALLIYILKLWWRAERAI